MVVFKGIVLLFNIVNFHVNMDFINNPLFHFHRPHYSIIPVFQYSNWGLAPKFYKEVVRWPSI